MIPKIIHYCWFGNNPLPEKAMRCKDSWKEHNPEFEIKVWDHSNFELKNEFVKKAYKYKQYAFVSDFARFKVLYEFGGIYLDTDMLVLKNFSEILEFNCFLGKENEELISCGIIGAEKGNCLMLTMLELYEQQTFDINNLIPVPILLTNQVKKFGNIIETDIHWLGNIKIFSQKYFYPMPLGEKNYEDYISPESYTVHLWNHGWKDEFLFLASGNFKEAMIYVLKNRTKNPIVSISYFKDLFYALARFTYLKVRRLILKR